jgi:hypothetical protein
MPAPANALAAALFIHRQLGPVPCGTGPQTIEKGIGDAFFDKLGFSRRGARNGTLFGNEFLKALKSNHFHRRDQITRHRR